MVIHHLLCRQPLELLGVTNNLTLALTLTSFTLTFLQHLFDEVVIEVSVRDAWEVNWSFPHEVIQARSRFFGSVRIVVSNRERPQSLRPFPGSGRPHDVYQMAPPVVNLVEGDKWTPHFRWIPG
jgi:hypothetical protein